MVPSWVARRCVSSTTSIFFLLAALGSPPPEGLPEIEGVGVLPDVEVAPCRRYCEGRDPQMMKALELAAAAARGGGSPQILVCSPITAAPRPHCNGNSSVLLRREHWVAEG